MDTMLFSGTQYVLISLSTELFILNMVWSANSLRYTLLSHSRSFNNMLLDFSKQLQCTDVMLKGLSNIIAQTCWLLCGHKKPNKLDDSEKIKIRGIGSKVKKHAKRSEIKMWKQVRDQKGIETS